MWNGSGRDVYFGYLRFPADPAAAVGILKGKSNFGPWHSAIEPILLSNPHSSKLIIGTWAEPRLPPASTEEEQAQFDEERRQWHSANTATCRFIRATLAENVVPFVRQYNTAKPLFFNLVWLYGEDAGIDTQGGPPVPANAPTLNAKRGRTSLLAVLEAKRTLDYLPPVGVTLNLPSPPSTTASSQASSSSCSSGSSSVIVEDQRKSPQTLVPESSQEQHTSLIRNFERTRISSDPNLETIHEHEEPHPGRRVPSGYAIDFKFDRSKDKQPRGSTSPLTLSDRDSQNEEDECGLEDLSDSQSSRPKKRQASSDQNSRPSKANIVSILKIVAKPGKSKTRDNLSFSFPLRRMDDTDRDKGKGREQ